MCRPRRPESRFLFQSTLSYQSNSFELPVMCYCTGGSASSSAPHPHQHRTSQHRLKSPFTPHLAASPMRTMRCTPVLAATVAPGKTFPYPLLQSRASKAASVIEFLVESRPKGRCEACDELFRRCLLHSHIIRMVLSKPCSLIGGSWHLGVRRRCSQACSLGRILHIVCKFTQFVTTHLWMSFAVVRRRK